MKKTYWIIIFLVVIVRLFSLTNPYNAEKYLENYYQSRTENLHHGIPFTEGKPDIDTPFFYNNICYIINLLFTHTSNHYFNNRLPSFISWLLLIIPIRKLSQNKNLATILWITTPLPIIWAGRNSPDMMFTLLLTMAIFFTYQNKNILSSLSILLGALTKIVSVIVIPGMILTKNWKSVIYSSLTFVIGLIFLYFYNPSAINGILWHINYRGYGIFSLQTLASATLFGTGFLTTYLIWTNLNDWKYKFILPILLFFLYSTPKWHDYYYLPVIPLFTILISQSDLMQEKMFRRMGIFFNISFSALQLAYFGDFGRTMQEWVNF